MTAQGSQPLNSTSLSQRVYPREAYRDQAQPDASSVFEQTPGAFVSHPFGENDAAPDVPVFPLVRGGLPYETAIGLDGAPVALPSTGTLDLSLLPTFVLGEVEILKGAGDPAGFGGSVGGAVNFRTADPTAVTRGMLEMEGDSTGGQFSDLAYDGTMPGGKISFATMASIDGEPGPLAGTSFPGAPASDALRKAVLLKIRAVPADGASVTATMLDVNLDRALAGAYGALLGDDFVSLAPTLGARQDERLRFEQVLGQYDEGDEEFEVRAYAFDLADDGYAANLALADALDSERGFGASWNHKSGPNLYTLSVDARGACAYNDGVTSVVPFGEPLAQGSAEGNARARASATLHVSSRTEVDLSAESVGDGERIGDSAWHDWSSFDTRAGLSQLLTPALSLRASAGNSGVAPPLDALASGIAPQFSLGLPSQTVDFSSSVTNLETSSGGDVGLEWRLHGDTTTLSFDAYDTETNNAYVLATSQPLPGITFARWSNAPAMRDTGIEVSLVQFKRVGLGFIVQAALPRTYTSGPLGANVAGIPYAQGYGEISYKWPRGSRLSFGATYLGSNNPYDEPAFVTCNSNLELSLGAKSKLQFSVQNVFDALDGRLPVVFMPTVANVLGPRTFRFMFRQSFGGGSIYER